MTDVPAPDAVDRILLHEAASLGAPARQVAVLDDETGALGVGAAEVVGAGDAPVRIYCDSAAAERRVLEEHARSGVTAVTAADLTQAVAGADLVLLRLPKTLAALEVIADAVARAADPSVQLLGGARIKHLNRAMNDVLLSRFASVGASLGQQKSRVLVAAQPKSSPAAIPGRMQWHADLSITLCALGGVFGGTSVDRGTRFLLGFADQFPSAGQVLDLGSGNGVLAVMAARRHPEAQVTAVDDSRDAVRSTLATAAANDVGDRVRVCHTDRLKAAPACVEPGSVDLVLCNPPFHRGTTRDSSAAYAMFADAARVLRPGGELWVVFNSHLPYLPNLRRVVGRTTVVGQNPRFTVTRSTRSLEVPPDDVGPSSLEI